MSSPTFYTVLSEAIRDFAEHGFDAQHRLIDWTRRIRESAEASLVPQDQMKRLLDTALSAVFNRLIEKEAILKTCPGVTRFDLQRIKPSLRSELDRRIMASANLIKLNREQMIARTLQRFEGWATSIPEGGSDVVAKRETSQHIRKSLAQLSFEERRVMIDQGHKLSSSLNEIVALDNDALGGVWRSHWKQAGYNYREDHKERDEKFYAVRSNWAMEKGLMKVGEYGYTDEITRPAEEPFCRCFYRWVFTLRDIPVSCLTIKGRETLKAVRL